MVGDIVILIVGWGNGNIIKETTTTTNSKAGAVDIKEEAVDIGIVGRFS